MGCHSIYVGRSTYSVHEKFDSTLMTQLRIMESLDYKQWLIVVECIESYWATKTSE